MRNVITKKNKLRKAIDEANEILKQSLYVDKLNDKRIHLMAFSREITYMIRVVLDKITEEDKEIMEEFYNENKNHIYEIWVKLIDDKSFHRIYFTDKEWKDAFPPIVKLGKKKDIIKIIAKESIYFILCPARNAVKIGRSINAKRRLSELRSQLFDDLELLKIIESDRSALLEKELHEKFKSYHIKGEWFKYNSNLKDFIEKL